MANDPWAVSPSLGTPPQGFKAPEVHNLGDVLDFQRAALQEAIFHKGTSDANRAALRAKMAQLPAKATIPAALYGMPLGEFYRYGAKHYDQLPHPIQGIYDAILDTGTDPLTLETLDTGALAKVGLRALASPIKALDKAHLPVWGPGVVTDLTHAATRLLNFGGDAINKVGRPAANLAIGMLNRQKAESGELFRRLQKMDADIMKGLTKTQTSAVQKIMHGQLPPELEQRVLQDPAIARAVSKRRELTDNLVRMQAVPGSDIEERLGGKPLPKELQPFSGQPGQFGTENYRKRYFPGHMYGKAVDPNQPAREIPLLDAGNPHVKEQTMFRIASKNVDDFEQAFQGMLKTSARSISANKARAELGKIYGGEENVPHALRDILTIQVPAKGTARTVGQKLAESVRGVVGIPKLGIVGTSPIHMFNILSLLILRAPEQVPRAALHLAQIMRAGGDETKRFEAMLPAIERGIDVATHEKGGTILSKLPLNRLTWNWDAAAKLALSDKYIKQGMHPIEAGVNASNDLVNYGNRSPLTGALRYFMPFATFAEGGAKAVLGAVAHQPALTEFTNRLTGGKLLGGGNHATDTTSYHPPANVGRGPLPYLRGKTSDLVKLPLALAAGAVPGGQGFERWMLSGRTPLGTAADIVTSPVPYARDILDMIPLPGGKNVRGYKPDNPVNQAVFSATGISLPSKPKAAAAPTPASNPNDPWAVGAPAKPAPSIGSPPQAKATSDPWAP